MAHQNPSDPARSERLTTWPDRTSPSQVAGSYPVTRSVFGAGRERFDSFRGRGDVGLLP